MRDSKEVAPSGKRADSPKMPIVPHGSLERITRMLNSMNKKGLPDKVEPEIPLNEDVTLHCVQFAHEQLGIDVKDADTSGDLNAADFDYIKVDVVTGGLTNILYKVTNTKNGRVVAVRMFGNKTEVFIDRMRERKIQRHLCAQGFAKNVYAYFNGGQIEDWLEGESLSEEDFQGFKYSKLIAQEMRKIHQSPGQAELYLALNPTAKLDGDVKMASMLWPRVWKFYEVCMENVNELQSIIGSHFNIVDLKLNIERLQRICEAVNSPIALCHGDLCKSNIVIGQSSKVLFIDYEYACIMERAYDIANHLKEFVEYNSNDYSLPSQERQDEFIRSYLGEGATEEDVEALRREIKAFVMVSDLHWGLWGLLQCVYSSIESDFPCYSVNRIKLFLQEIKSFDQF
ncbi:protein kinase-like protein [Babesia gibsoni]|uniref:ethanolamine kinase n=1 Tax=Babesia gibsoni TaxID=33632 RepID=A0AAD8LQP3_BABGI|nr:protein kinase-like protein [Babesia gibsoni]